MIQFFITGGIFMWLLLILLVVELILIARYGTDLWGGTPVKTAQLHTILFIGISSVALGMFGQILGLLEGFKSMLITTDLSPVIVERGFSISFHPTIFGFIICFISAIAWYALYRQSTNSR